MTEQQQCTHTELDTAAVQRHNTDEVIADVGLISLQPVMEFSLLIEKQVSGVDISR